MAAKPKKQVEIQWGLVDADWVAGIKTTRQMSADYELLTGQKISHVAIVKHYDKLGMKRDLKGKIRAKAEVLVNAQLTAGVLRLPEPTERQIIEVAAQNQADIILRHRSDIQRYKSIAGNLIGELEATTQNVELFTQLGELMRSEDANGVDRLNDAYQKVVALPGRTGVMKQLAEVLKILVGLERQAFGLSDNANGEADKPAAPELSPTEAARRVAFMLMRGAQKGA